MMINTINQAIETARAAMTLLGTRGACIVINTLATVIAG